MAKVVAIHTLQLQPGVTQDQWERYLREEFNPAQLPGCHLSVGKAERGRNAGGYALLAEMDSQEVRSRYFPSEGQPSEEFRHLGGEFFSRLFTLVQSTYLGDYVIEHG